MEERKSGWNAGDAMAENFRPRLALYHASARGTGCAVKIELHPAHGQKDGCFMLTAASQSVVGDRTGAAPKFARFDWENSITVKLDFADLCQFLQVFRGESESIGDGRGLFHTSQAATTKICLRHIVDPVPGYLLDLFRTPRGRAEIRAHFMFSPSEAQGLRCVIEGSMCYVCFGIPMVIPRNVPASGTVRKETDDAAA